MSDTLPSLRLSSLSQMQPATTDPNSTTKSKGVALITGSSQGIGKAIALRLASDGYDIALNDLSSKLNKLEEVEKTITQEMGRKSTVFCGDVSDEETVQQMVKGVVEQLGSLDVMVANAGINAATSLVETTTQEWDRTFAINARGTFLCYKYAAIQMISQGRGGRIIGACSVSGKQGRELGTTYCATKFAIRSLTQTSALELGKYGITVNAYAPGAVDTEILKTLTSALVTSEGNEEAVKDIWRQAAPVGRLGQPEDIAHLVSYLVSKEAGFVTGQAVSINGGRFFD
ncbi:acetoin reductase family protein [Dendrothele bispora CBS 962.96]|uniref:Acetoin reductase family protein n=1 Tax=Dendrothele bispora (strain CBS 962.96) TaxID=1314807 RepID=A0A4S8LQJ2_DENBC|nr:acetoin reductase family protein [Dendrothele bispora CBS 962.96]